MQSVNPVVGETNDSGDYALAFSTADQAKPGVAEKDLDRLFAAVSESVEEALLNSLFMAKTVMGFRGHIRYAVPHDRVLEMLRAHTPFKIAENDT